MYSLEIIIHTNVHTENNNTFKCTPQKQVYVHCTPQKKVYVHNVHPKSQSTYTMYTPKTSVLTQCIPQKPVFFPEFLQQIIYLKVYRIDFPFDY